MSLKFPKAFELLKKVCFTQASRSGFEDCWQVLAHMNQVDTLSCNFKHEFSVIVEALFDLMVVNRLVPDPMDKRVDKGEVSFVVILFFVGDICWFDNFHLADVYLTR